MFFKKSSKSKRDEKSSTLGGKSPKNDKLQKARKTLEPGAGAAYKANLPWSTSVPAINQVQLTTRPGNPSRSLSYDANTRDIRAPPAYRGEGVHHPQIAEHRSMSTTVLPLVGSSQPFDGNMSAIDPALRERARFDRIARDMDATIAAIDVLNSSEEQELAGDILVPNATRSNPAGPLTLQALRSVQSRSSLAGNYFSKVWLYANSRLPPHLPPFKVYMPTYPLLCLAAQYSLLSYSRSVRPQLLTTIPASLRNGTKASLILLHPNDTTNTIVLAIRGTHSFADWAVNLSSAPASPAGFLEDSGNLVHGGFLSVAKSMLNPLATRLRAIIADHPARRNASLLLTGHSAGGAVAALLYAHLAAPDDCGIDSELRGLRGFLGRIHCITFGSPPVSFLPLHRPRLSGRHHRPDQYYDEYGHSWRKSLFFSFVNEGDPVVRAGDTAYVRSLLSLYASPAPVPDSIAPSNGKTKTGRKPNLERPPVWQVPPTSFSNSGRIVLLRSASSQNPNRTHPSSSRVKGKVSLGGIGKVGKKIKAGSAHASEVEGVQAFMTSDEQLRGIVFGDPAMHAMRLYAARIERLAIDAVTAGVFDS